MSEMLLKGLDISNFRSIRGHVHAPLDASVVLIHGENGAGKTSLLSAIELALTGGVTSLQRADPNYSSQLLYRAADNGRVALRAILEGEEQEFSAVIGKNGAQSTRSLGEMQATFFRERTFLPQSLLGQLLQIYQESGSDADSPLARFVGKLLGLDRLDAIEIGLKPFVDVRNVRKAVDGWLAAENEKSRLERLLSDQSEARDVVDAQVKLIIGELAELCASLGLGVIVTESQLDSVATELNSSADSQAFDRLADQQRRLGSIMREIQSAQGVEAEIGSNAGIASQDSSANFLAWEDRYGSRFVALRQRVEACLPDVSLSSAPDRLADEALPRLRTSRNQLVAKSIQAREARDRLYKIEEGLELAIQRRDTINSETEQLSDNAGSLGSAIAELTSFIVDDVCPVCSRDFREVSETSLSDHVHQRVRTLSAMAERLLNLSRARTEVQIAIEQFGREVETVSARILEPSALANIERQALAVDGLISELEEMAETLLEGGRLRNADVAMRRRVNEAQSRHVALTAARQTLGGFALSIGMLDLAEGESIDFAAKRISEKLRVDANRLELRLSMRRKGADHIGIIRSSVSRRKDIEARISSDMELLRRTEKELALAQTRREQSIAIRSAVEKVRSVIIRREFNERLNRLWRDLFVRLAPNEPFVPAFRIPQSSTQRLQPKLVTEHRDGGGIGGTPGAMLSAGNLNTAALTLFVALHLSVPRDLPWLILDDPVQSMDDIHIAHFAALLRTLSKEQGRQVVIAVHDRQLFEYLKLELSPAFVNDSLLTLELSRGARRDSVCIAKRFSYQEETAFLTAA